MLEPELRPLVEFPGESLTAEYKDWLDLSTPHGRATLTKHAIALANHGGGHIILGFSEEPGRLVSRQPPVDLPDITQDSVNAAIRRYADPGFQCQMRLIAHEDTGVLHPVITVPGEFSAPVMSKRDAEGVMRQYRIYMRKQGPRSEEPQTHAEWKELIERCVRAGRADLLDAIRSIVTGRVQPGEPMPDAQEELYRYRLDSRDRWMELTSNLEESSPAKFRWGYHEVGLSLVEAAPAASFNELRRRLDEARDATSFSGWPLFINLDRAEFGQTIHGEFLEAWVGNPSRKDFVYGPSTADFWRVSNTGQLYSIRGYSEDDASHHAQSGTVFDVRIPAARVGEALIFAGRLATMFDEVDHVALQCRFTGLADRHLTHLGAMGVWPRFTLGQSVSRTLDVELQKLVTLRQIEDNLAEVVHEFLCPLYERFGFYQLPLATVQAALQDMRP